MYGYAVEPETISRSWQRVEIKREALQFMYSSGEQGKLDFGNIQQIELTLEKPEGGSEKGALYLRGLTYKQ